MAHRKPSKRSLAAVAEDSATDLAAVFPALSLTELHPE